MRKRIVTVEEIAEDLFKEWEEELKEISDQRLRSKSAQSLKVTRERYGRLHSAMKKAESKHFFCFPQP